jgi:uncharacterized membrane protein YGL010W
MRPIQKLLDKYGESHTHSVNKTIHWICVPLILFSIVGMIRVIPWITQESWILNWAGVVLALALIYYFRLSFTLAIGFLAILLLMLFAQQSLLNAMLGDKTNLLLLNLVIFVLAWVGQFIGHKIEGEKPSFLEDLQFLLIGPAWLMHFIYNKLGIPY